MLGSDSDCWLRQIIAGCGPGYLVGEFYDTINPSAQPCTVRFQAHDISGRVVMHCHILKHEDAGAMTWLNVPGGPELGDVTNPPATPLTCSVSSTTSSADSLSDGTTVIIGPPVAVTTLSATPAPRSPLSPADDKPGLAVNVVVGVSVALVVIGVAAVVGVMVQRKRARKGRAKVAAAQAVVMVTLPATAT